jgi:hypothetical protein
VYENSKNPDKNAQGGDDIAAKVPSDTASRERFALTQVVLGIDLSRSAVPSYLLFSSQWFD